MEEKGDGGGEVGGDEAGCRGWATGGAVSYTHLTLPTIYSV